MQNEKNIRDVLRAVLEKLIEVAPTAEQEWPELVRRAKDALASGDIDPAWAGVCAACSEGIPPARCAYFGDPNGCNAPTLGKHPEGDLAERLQDELEKAERRIAELERVTGDVLALREALEAARREARDCYDGGEYLGEGADPGFLRILAIIEAAIAAPPEPPSDATKMREAILAIKEINDKRPHDAAGYEINDIIEEALATAKGSAKCVNGLRGEPDCRGCDEHCLDVRKRNCFYWNTDIGKCALDGKPSCRIACDNFRVSKEEKPAPAEGGAE